MKVLRVRDHTTGTETACLPRLEQIKLKRLLEMRRLPPTSAGQRKPTD